MCPASLHQPTRAPLTVWGPIPATPALTNSSSSSAHPWQSWPCHSGDTEKLPSLTPQARQLPPLSAVHSKPWHTGPSSPGTVDLAQSSAILSWGYFTFSSSSEASWSPGKAMASLGIQGARELLHHSLPLR